jgi:hypothetical protein
VNGCANKDSFKQQPSGLTQLPAHPYTTIGEIAPYSLFLLSQTVTIDKGRFAFLDNTTGRRLVIKPTVLKYYFFAWIALLVYNEYSEIHFTTDKVI